MVERLTLESREGRQSKANLLFPNSGRNCCSNLQAEPSSIFDASTILIRPDIADILGKLVDEVSEESVDEPTGSSMHDLPIGSVNLNTITSCTKDKVFGGLSVKADILFDLVYR